jgi:integrase
MSRYGKKTYYHTQQIRHSYDYRYGFKETKTARARDIPIPTKTSQALQYCMDNTPYTDNIDCVFWGRGKDIPLSKDGLTDPLYRALHRIGISEEERRERNLSFHSHRHFFNSVMRGKIHDSKLRRLTGHRTEAMTEHYTRFKVEDFSEVLEVQEALFQ